ncbi:MAG: hypothetical protein ACI4OA_10040, partial [Selenomonadaceae bacterium]
MGSNPVAPTIMLKEKLSTCAGLFCMPIMFLPTLFSLKMCYNNIRKIMCEILIIFLSKGAFLMDFSILIFLAVGIFTGIIGA